MFSDVDLGACPELETEPVLRDYKFCELGTHEELHVGIDPGVRYENS